MKILNRKDFVDTIYTPLKEQKEYEKLKSVNEGMLKTLFGTIKNMFKRDWASIKGDQGIIKAYKEMDDKLTGFSTMKLSKKDVCNKIRQYLVDFACDWYDYKKNRAKEDDEMTPAKNLKFKDDTLKENLEKTKKMIKDVADGDKQMIKWANLLMDEMTIVINRVIMNEIDDEDVKQEIKEQEDEEFQKYEEENKKMEELQNKQLQEVSKERETYISNAGATPMKAELTGDKTVNEICAEFKKLSDAVDKVFESYNIDDDIEELNEATSSPEKENILKVLQNDTMLGFKKIFEDTKKVTKNKFLPTYKMMNAFYTNLNKNDIIEKFKEVPSQSIQAMCISINSFIKNVIYSTDASDQIPLMAKCAIVSNGVISYNLPVNDKGDGNYYTDIMGRIANEEFNKNDKTIKFPKGLDFKKNSSDMMKKIIDEAKKLKEEAEKKYDDQMKNLKLNDENEKEEE